MQGWPSFTDLERETMRGEHWPNVGQGEPNDLFMHLYSMLNKRGITLWQFNV